jgi:hypothetical protein
MRPFPLVLFFWATRRIVDSLEVNQSSDCDSTEQSRETTRDIGKNNSQLSAGRLVVFSLALSQLTVALAIFLETRWRA